MLIELSPTMRHAFPQSAGPDRGSAPGGIEAMASGTKLGSRVEADLLTPAYRRRFLIVAFLVSTFNFADRAVFAVLAQPIKGDLHLSVLDLGILQGLAFAVLYAALGVPIGRLAERASRVRIVAAAILFWSAMTAMCSMVGNFMQLLLCRI